MSRSIRAGSNFGIQSSGDHATNIYVGFDGPPPRPESVDYVPPTPNHLSGPFVGREQELIDLHSALTAENGDNTQAITGLGGIGKTTLAKRYAVAYRHHYTFAHRLLAETVNQIEAELARLAAKIDARFALAPVPFAAAWARSWLATHEGWLLILDNVNDRNDVLPLIEELPGGRFLITSRVATGWRGIQTLKLRKLSAEAAAVLLAELAGEVELSQGPAICEKLDNLPLAIELAGAYLEQAQISTTEYLNLLQEHQSGEIGDGTLKAVSDVWQLTLARIEAEMPGAVELLRVLAWFNLPSVPRAMLSPLSDQPAVHRELGLLARYSMIDLDPESVSSHRLVQAAGRASCSTDPDEPSRDLAAALLSTAITSGTISAPTAAIHVAAFIDVAPKGVIESATAVALYTVASAYLQNAQFAHGTALTLERLLTYYTERLGPQHPTTLATANQLGSALITVGDLERAMLLLFETAASYKAMGEPAEPARASVLNNLGNAFFVAEQFEPAIQLLEKALNICERALGPSDPATLRIRYNLAAARDANGKRPLMDLPETKAVINDIQRVLGPDHPDALSGRHVLVSLAESNGDFQQAIRMLESLTANAEQVHGAADRRTLSMRTHLSSLYYKSGNFAEAIAIAETALVDAEEALGPADEDTTFLVSALEMLRQQSHPARPDSG